MNYERPEVRDFGNIAQHTYLQGDDDIIYCGASANICDAIDAT